MADGAPTEDAAGTELASTTVGWHRLQALQHVSLRLIAQAVLPVLHI